MYSISLFLHIVGALAIFASLAVEQAALFNLRRASTNAQVRDALSLLKGLRFMGVPALVLLATGIYMMATRWRSQTWAGLGIVGMIVIALIGGLVTGRRMKRISQAVPTDNGPMPATLRSRIADPALQTSAWVRLALALSIVFNMSVKPGTVGAVAALVIAVVLGALTARLGSSPRRVSLAVQDGR